MNDNNNDKEETSGMVKHAAVRVGTTPSEQSGKPSVRVVDGEALADKEKPKKEFDQHLRIF